MRRRLTIALAASALALGACGDSEGPGQTGDPVGDDEVEVGPQTDDSGEGADVTTTTTGETTTTTEGTTTEGTTTTGDDDSGHDDDSSGKGSGDDDHDDDSG